MTLATFHSDIASIIARGSSQNGNIPRWTRRAAQWLEQNYDFQYMEMHGQTTLDPLAVAPNVINLPSDRVKGVLSIRPFMDSNGSRFYEDPLPKVDFADVTAIDPGFPSGWWQVGDDILVDTNVVTPLSLELVYVEYTDWPTDLSATPKLLRRYENLLEAQTMMNAWRDIKDAEAYQSWQNTRDEALRAILVSEEEAAWKGKVLQMRPDW